MLMDSSDRLASSGSDLSIAADVDVKSVLCSSVVSWYLIRAGRRPLEWMSFGVPELRPISQLNSSAQIEQQGGAAYST